MAALPPDGDEEVAESLKAFRDAEVRLIQYSKALTTSSFQAVFCGMDNHVLPMPQAVAHLLYAVGLLVGMSSADFKDASGDISWTKGQKVFE